MKKFLSHKTVSIITAAIMCLASLSFTACDFFNSAGGGGTSSGGNQNGGGTSGGDNNTDTTYTLAQKRNPSDELYSLTFETAMGKDVMPVGVYSGPYSAEREYHGQQLPSMVSKEYFDLYRDMGINFFTATLGDRDPKIQDFLTLCDEYDMGAFVTFNGLIGEGNASYVSVDSVEKNLDKFADDHKSLLGFYLRDEPTKGVIDKIQLTTNALAKSFYRKNKYAYVNALPEWAGDYCWEGSDVVGDWEDYLRTYCEQLKVKYLSFDFYPWYLNPQDGSIVYRSGYIKNLSIAKKVADEFKIPLWSCKQCGAYQEYIPLENEKFIPGENEFRWQMSIDLSYGVKGYTYFLLCGDALGYDNIWEKGIDDYFGLFNAYTGQPNRWYYYSKEFDKHLTKIESVIVNAAHEGVIMSGDVREANYVKTAGNGEWIQNGSYYELDSVESTYGAWTGCYNYNGQTVLYVTNDSCNSNNTVTLNFNDKYGYTVYQSDKTEWLEGSQITLELLPGEGAMVTLKYE